MNIQQVLDPDKVKKLFHAKTKYGQLFAFSSAKFLAVFRPLSVDETEVLADLTEKLNIYAIEDWVFESCFITGSHSVDYFLTKGPFFAVSEISSQLPLLSNIQEEDDYKKKILNLRSQSNRVQNVVESIICKAFNGYKSSDLRRLPQNKILDILVKAETISGNKLDLNLGNKPDNKALRNFNSDGTTVIGGTEFITSPDVADKPDFNSGY